MYHVEFTPTAAEDLARLNKPIAQRILRVRKFITYRKQAENGRYKTAISGSYLVFGP